MPTATRADRQSSFFKGPWKLFKGYYKGSLRFRALRAHVPKIVYTLASK